MEELKKANVSLLNCKYCRGVLLKDIHTHTMEGNVQFRLRCPHCQKDSKVQIEIDKSPTVELIE